MRELAPAARGGITQPRKRKGKDQAIFFGSVRPMDEVDMKPVKKGPRVTCTLMKRKTESEWEVFPHRPSSGRCGINLSFGFFVVHQGIYLGFGNSSIQRPRELVPAARGGITQSRNRIFAEPCMQLYGSSVAILQTYFGVPLLEQEYTGLCKRNVPCSKFPPPVGPGNVTC